MTAKKKVRGATRRPLKAGLRRGAAPAKKNPARRKREFARAYGSKERVAWVRTLPCVVCGLSPCDNAHVRGGGMGYKAGYVRIAPLCTMRWDGDKAQNMGCHWTSHMMGRRMFEKHYSVDLDAAAARIEQAWQEHLQRSKTA